MYGLICTMPVSIIRMTVFILRRNIYIKCTHEAFKDVHAVNSFINYDLPLKKVFNKISFLARYDMMTDHSDGKMDETTKALIINDYARHRVTVESR